MFKTPLFVVVTVVATFNLSVAQNHSDPGSSGQHPSSSFFGIPLPFQFPQFQFPQLPFFREEEAGGPPADAPSASADAPGSSEHEDGHQDKFFFGLFHPPSTYVACNSTTQAGATCTSCTTALTCGTANVGRLRACRGFFPYCNLGRCSFIPGALCVNATATG